MTGHVVFVSAKAERDLDSAYRYRRRHAPITALRWKLRLRAFLQTLADQPDQWPLAPQAEYWRKPIRQRFFGKRRQAFRILFEVAGKSVFILRIRWGARAFMLSKEAP